MRRLKITAPFEFFFDFFRKPSVASGVVLGGYLGTIRRLPWGPTSCLFLVPRLPYPGEGGWALLPFLKWWVPPCDGTPPCTVGQQWVGGFEGREGLIFSLSGWVPCELSPPPPPPLRGVGQVLWVPPLLILRPSPTCEEKP